MLNEFLFFYMLIVHFLADFALQTNDQALNKGAGHSFFNKWLFYHVGTYTLIWFFSILAISQMYNLTIWGCVYFSTITFICHYITDWVTSRVGKPFWSKQDYHNGFAVVGFDQILHYTHLYFTFKYFLL